jgi:hypothetical protein
MGVFGGGQAVLINVLTWTPASSAGTTINDLSERM